MTNEELNRKISEARESKPSPYFGVPEYVAKIRRSEFDAWRCEWMKYDDGNSEGHWNPRDWTGSEDASAVLLEEMPEPLLFFMPRNKSWWCDPNSRHEINVESSDRKTAIALAWLKWKGVEK